MYLEIRERQTDTDGRGIWGRRRVSGQLEFGEEDHTATLGRAWELALHLLASKVSTVAFATYIQPVQPLTYIGKVVTLGVANAFFRERLEKNHANALRSALEFHLDTTGLQIVLIVMSRDQQRTAETKRSEAGRSKPKLAQTSLSLDEEFGEDSFSEDGLNENDSREASSRESFGKEGSGKTQNPDRQPGRSEQTEQRNQDLGQQERDDKKKNFSSTTGFRPASSSRTSHNSNSTGANTSAPNASSNNSPNNSSNISSGTGKSSIPPSSSKPKANNSKGDSPAIPCMPLNERYRFDSFLLGRSNRLAHAGAVSVAERPGEVYNPLFLYGGPGLGKTHLMHGIAHEIRRRNPALRIAYVSGEYFAQQYITSIHTHVTEDFRRQYREVDVWLVDDIQFIANKNQTKEEFFHTFNALYQTGKQIVIASDRSPRELNTMDERLRSRFQSGLIADISAPELETRIAILRQCREREGFIVENDVLDYIASAIQSNIRALEGALTKLIAYSSIHNTSATAELAQSVLSEYFIEKPIRSRKISIDDIIDAVAPLFAVAPAAIHGPNRNKDVSLARQVAMYLSRELIPELNTTDVGKAFGNRDHATIVYASQRVRGLMDLDAELRTLVGQIQKKLSI